MCLLRRRQLDPKSRRFYAAGNLCLVCGLLPSVFSAHGFGHSHSALFDSLRFVLLGSAIGLLYWSTRRKGGCASHS